MWLITGLGNPGPDYTLTRHNLGFMVVDRLAGRIGTSFGRRHSSLWGTAELAGQAVSLQKPQTFMNASGMAVAPALDDLDLSPSQLLVIYDDLDLPFGSLRLKPGGGHGGHRGIRSVVQTLERRDFPRLRLGIGHPPAGIDVVDWVLSPFDAADREELPALIDRAADAVEAVLERGVGPAASVFNAKPRVEVPDDEGAQRSPDEGTPEGSP